jgi:hypothetical protein
MRRHLPLWTAIFPVVGVGFACGYWYLGGWSLPGGVVIGFLWFSIPVRR